MRNTVNSKLYIAGEYAILEPGSNAIIQKIPLSMDSKIQINQNNIIILNSSIFDYSISVKLSEINFVEKYDINYSLMQYSIAVVIEYLQLLGYSAKAFNLNIDSQLHDQNNQKFGLGSSGAVIVLTIKSVLALYQIDYSSDLLFRLSVISLLRQNNNGSMGDVACISYNALVTYTSFDRNYVKDLIANKNVLEVIQSEWPQLKIERLDTKLKVNLLIGWTQQHADSNKLVSQANKINQKIEYKKFVDESNKLVQRLVNYFKNGTQQQIKEYFRKCRNNLQNFAKLSKIEIETVKIKTVLDQLDKFNIVAKTSGAGAGDCIIALSFSDNDKQLIKNVWQQYDIKLLGEYTFE